MLEGTNSRIAETEKELIRWWWKEEIDETVGSAKQANKK